jgi:hypothetical protein
MPARCRPGAGPVVSLLDQIVHYRGAGGPGEPRSAPTDRGGAPRFPGEPFRPGCRPTAHPGPAGAPQGKTGSDPFGSTPLQLASQIASSPSPLIPGSTHGLAGSSPTVAEGPSGRLGPLTLRQQAAPNGAMPSILERSPPVLARRIGPGRKVGPRLADTPPDRWTGRHRRNGGWLQGIAAGALPSFGS